MTSIMLIDLRLCARDKDRASAATCLRAVIVIIATLCYRLDIVFFIIIVSMQTIFR